MGEVEMSLSCTDTDPADAPWRLGALDLVALYRQRRLSPVEATRSILRRIADQNGRINAYCLVDEERALDQARRSETRWTKGAPQGLLDGVPVSIKDLVLTSGWPTLKGSRTVRPDQSWTEDAPSVARLREHGAVLIGKTTTPEFGWKALGDSPLTGVTRNPWNLEMTPGGSSGGAAAALAAGMAPLAIGSDGAGSIRIPAAFTGVFGIKATFGRVAAYPPSTISTMANVGPMARTVRDAALMLEVIGRSDARDAYAPPFAPGNYLGTIEEGVRGLRLGFAPQFGGAKAEPEIAALAASATRAFEKLGAVVEEIDPPLGDIRSSFQVLWCAGNENGLRLLPEEQRARLEPALDAYGRSAAAITTMDYLAAVSARERLSIAMNRLHETYDLLLTPAVAVAAFPVERMVPDGGRWQEWWDWAPYSYPFNLTQQPAASVPCGLTAGRLPVGLQIVGPRWADSLVLRAARAFERAQVWTMPWQ
jgi:aspartyl-tRNA(Asn)/glutamyl-tRNA(Gln) amidotransferase subunit A